MNCLVALDKSKNSMNNYPSFIASLRGTKVRQYHCFFIVSVVTVCAIIANGATIPLSTYSSDETPAQDLAASFDFSVMGTTLTLVVINGTDGPDDHLDGGFDINQIYFNAAPNVTGLTLLSPSSGWKLSTNPKAAGFGKFDFGLTGGVGNSAAQIDGEMSETFIFDMSGTGPFLDTYFTTIHSTIPPGDTPSLVAAKFVEGPGDDSAYGATAPEPAALSLLLISGATMLKRRQR